MLRAPIGNTAHTPSNAVARETFSGLMDIPPDVSHPPISDRRMIPVKALNLVGLYYQSRTVD